MNASALDTSIRGVAQRLLGTLRLLGQADDQRFAVQNGDARGHDQAPPRRKADEAVDCMMTQYCSMYDGDARHPRAR
ncbi:hypothetical protein ACIBI9_57015 [Nonomuraea sp. NPDC050451]|uniref:hypothetical protein n=1 Tax=Nonomuraea sp. NPDC050451 TaxID=3364364 RepID=UPI003799F95D